MKENRKSVISKEEERIKHIQYIMDHWDDLPDRLSGKIEGIISTIADLVPTTKSKIKK